MSFSSNLTRQPASCPVFDEVFDSDDWAYVSGAQISNSYQYFDADSNVVTAYNFRMDALLNGGILIRVHGHKMKPEVSAWMSYTFGLFVRQAVRSRWCVGFVACTWERDAVYGGMPVVLDLTQVIVKYNLSVTGKPSYRYFLKPAFGSPEMKEMRNVWTYSYSPPDAWGNLRAMMSLLAPDFLHETLLAYFQVVAGKGRAMPAIITSQPVEKHDPNNLRGVDAAVKPALNTRGAGAAAAADSVDQSMTIMNSTARYYQSAQPTLGNAVMENLAPLLQIPFFTSHVKLQTGRVYVAPQMPEAPDEMLLKFRIARQERAFALMGVPLSMLTNENSSMSANKKGSSESATNKSSSGGSSVLFENSQQALKLDMIHLIQSMFLRMHLGTLMNNYLSSTPSKDWSSSGMQDSTDVTVEIPSIPDEDRLQQYYQNGWLKYEALTRYLGSKHGIPEDCWESTPSLNIKEANGIQPKPPAGK